MTDKHVFVETSFLYLIAHMPHRQLPALDLWERFLAGELLVHIPYLCFQEAWRKIKSSLDHDPAPEVQELRRYLQDQEVPGWDDDSQLTRFFAQAEKYRRRELIPGTREKRFSDVRNTLVNRGSVIHGEDAIFDLMPIDMDHQLKYNDHLILASVIHCAHALAQVSDTCEFYFCSTDAGDLGPSDSRPKLKTLYESCSIRFVPGFGVP